VQQGIFLPPPPTPATSPPAWTVSLSWGRGPITCRCLAHPLADQTARSKVNQPPCPFGFPPFLPQSLFGQLPVVALAELKLSNGNGSRFRAPTLSCSRATASAAPVIQRSSGSQTPPASPGYSLGSSPGTPTRGWSTRRASPGRLRCTGSLFRPWTPLATPRRMSPLASRLRLP
jgi:hypothetical protein